jgi:hypothetical protein
MIFADQPIASSADDALHRRRFVEQLAQAPLPWTATRLGSGEQRRQNIPFIMRQITRVVFICHLPYIAPLRHALLSFERLS